MLSWRKAAMKVEFCQWPWGMALRQRCPPRAATSVAGHFGVQACFIDEDQMTNIPAGLLPSPKPPGGFNIGTVLLGGARRFFYSSDPVVPSGAIKR